MSWQISLKKIKRTSNLHFKVQNHLLSHFQEKVRMIEYFHGREISSYTQEGTKNILQLTQVLPWIGMYSLDSHFEVEDAYSLPKYKSVQP